MNKTMTKSERDKLEILYSQKYSPRQIAHILHRHPATIYRELKRGMYTRLNSDYTTRRLYSADKGQHRKTFEQAAKGAPLKVGNDHAFCAYIASEIKKKHSPAVALANIDRYGLHFKTKICLRTLYSYIDKGIFNISVSDLWEHGKRRRKQSHKQGKRPPRGISIEDRPREVSTRQSFGHWELDSIIGTRDKGATVLSLVERKTRFLITFKTNGKTAAETVRFVNSLSRKFGRNFPLIFKTITCDNGCEFSDFQGIETLNGKRRTSVFYCHPYCSSERGTNENHNRLLRRFIPKGKSIDRLSASFISSAADALNDYPRKILNWKTPRECFESELSIMKS